MINIYEISPENSVFDRAQELQCKLNEYKEYLQKDQKDSSTCYLCERYITKSLRLVAQISNELLQQRDVIDELNEIEENLLKEVEYQDVEDKCNIIDIICTHLTAGIVQIRIDAQLPHKYRWGDVKTSEFDKLMWRSFEDKFGKKPIEIWDKAYIFYEFHSPSNAKNIRDPDNNSTKALTDIISYYFTKASDDGKTVSINMCCVADEDTSTVISIVKPDEIETYMQKYMHRL